MEANGAACAKAGSHTPKGGSTQGAFPGPCKFPGAGGSACDADGPGVNAKPQGKGAEGPGVHVVGERVSTAGEGRDAVRIGSVLGAGTGERVRARERVFATADKASGLARVPDRPPPGILNQADGLHDSWSRFVGQVRNLIIKLMR